MRPSNRPGISIPRRSLLHAFYFCQNLSRLQPRSELVCTRRTFSEHHPSSVTSIYFAAGLLIFRLKYLLIGRLTAKKVKRYQPKKPILPFEEINGSSIP